MTLWQDARPLTRREARENEREASLERERKSGSRRSAVIEAEAAQEIRAVVDAPGAPASPLAVFESNPAGVISSSPAVVSRADARDSRFNRTLTRRELRAMLAARDGGLNVGNPVSEEPAAGVRSDQTAVPPSRVVFAPGSGASDVPVDSSPSTTVVEAVARAIPRQTESVPRFDRTIVPNRVDGESIAVDRGRLVDEARGATVIGTPRAPDTLGAEPHESFDQIVSRSVATTGAVTTTNALILPSMPASSAIRSGPVRETGDVLLTGSIDLPKSLGTTGAHPNRFDSAEIDGLFDQSDDIVDTGAIIPVKASSAVSTNTSSQGVLAPASRTMRGMPTMLAVTAATMALGVVVLFVGAVVLRVF